MATRKEFFPIVSVVITTKNEDQNIRRCIQSILNQTYGNLELILVDNYSNDRTVEIGKEYGARVFLKGNERSDQRNYGVKMANGSYVIYLDADMILSKNLIAECVEECERNHIDALYIPERIVGAGFWILVRNFERSFYTGTIIDAVRFVRKSIFEEIGGFDEELIGPEDWDFDRRVRAVGKVAVATTELYHNEGRFNIKKYLSKKRYYGKGIQKYIKKWGEQDPEVIKQIGVRYRLFDVFVEKGKYKKLLAHPQLATAMYFLRFRVALGFLKRS
jgi:glycosyltransferase involved in cell wall biosynthesis